ncbi:hypothetical protein [Bradyrhizobium prioriisuperbiae]|uniref:hypothetical protein n=1 Tax=Bradyrhizobium prioriisuperbiae TaxID=2854389 RepID=UPI0028E47AD3|nr:hypothetical protein [Bradyrhizobium prioritasuperba]
MTTTPRDAIAIDGLSDPEHIWLQNDNDAIHQGYGRMWCENKVWPEDPEDGEPTKYVRADIAADTIDALTARVKELEGDRDSWKLQFDSASAAASEYSEFWEEHHGDFDQFGNYIPYSQIDGDLRAANARATRLQQERDEAYERAAKMAEQFAEPYALYSNTGAMMFRAVTDKIVAAIRQLASSHNEEKQG